MFTPTKDPFNAGLFLPVRKQFSKGGSTQLQGHAWFILAEVNANGWVCACCDHGVIRVDSWEKVTVVRPPLTHSLQDFANVFVHEENV